MAELKITITQVEITTIQLYRKEIQTAQLQLQAYINEQIMGSRKLKGKNYNINTETWELEEVKSPDENKKSQMG